MTSSSSSSGKEPTGKLVMTNAQMQFVQDSSSKFPHVIPKYMPPIIMLMNCFYSAENNLPQNHKTTTFPSQNIQSQNPPSFLRLKNPNQTKPNQPTKHLRSPSQRANDPPKPSQLSQSPMFTPTTFSLNSQNHHSLQCLVNLSAHNANRSLTNSVRF